MLSLQPKSYRTVTSKPRYVLNCHFCVPLPFKVCAAVLLSAALNAQALWAVYGSLGTQWAVVA